MWVPLLDTTLLTRLASGRKKENYFPIAVADNKFHCIILKGGDQYPYFPRPLLSEFDFSIPLTSQPSTAKDKSKKKKKKHAVNGDPFDDDLDEEMGEDSDEDEDDEEAGADDEDISESRKLEQTYLLRGLQASQLSDLLDATSSTAAQRSTLARLELDVDKTLIQLLAVECREGEDRGMRALELVKLMRDRSGRMIEAAGKVAERYGRTILGEKIRELGEERVSGAFGDDD